MSSSKIPQSQQDADAATVVVDDEQTPLLANGVVAPAADPDVAEALVEPNDNDDEKPLPMAQIVMLCYARLIEPIGFFGILPFVNQMVQQNGSLPEAEVGFYSGLIESLFSLTQMIVMIFWGQASDRFGRKPVLIVSMVGVIITTSMFGFAKTIWQMILFRCLAGVFAGSIVTIRTMITELSTPKTQARAFSYFAFAGNLGILIGPLVGGALADPAGQYGGVFKRIAFFEQYPYALPTLLTGVFGLTSTVLVAFLVEETLETKKNTGSKSATSGQPAKSLSIVELVKQPGVAFVTYLYAHIMILAYGYTAIVSVFWFTSINLGGFSFTPIQISMWMALTGGCQAIWILVIFPPLQHRYSTGWVLRACSILYLPFVSYNALLNLLLRHAEAHDVKWERTLFWVTGTVLLGIFCSVSMSFTAIQLSLNDVSPSRESLGALNGLALSVISGVRAFSPALFTSIYAIGVKKQIFGGQLIWVVLTVIAVGFVALAYNLPPNAEGRLAKDPASDDRESSSPEVRR